MNSPSTNKTITPIAVFRSPFPSKFGIPRQSGVVDEIEGQIVFEPEFAREEALRGLENFEYIWIIWGFSGNDGKWSLTVRPPRLGGNRSVGVFASRSPFRPNGIGLSSARLVKIEDGRITVSGADLMDGTPIYDIKPYIPYTDSHAGVRAGFTDTAEWRESEVEFPKELQDKFVRLSGLCVSERGKAVSALVSVLAQRPVPQYIHNSERIFGMPFMGCDIRFQIKDNKIIVTDIVQYSGNKSSEQ